MDSGTLAIVLTFPLAAAVVAGGYAFAAWMRAWHRRDWPGLRIAALWLVVTWLAVGMLGAKVVQLLQSLEG